MIERIGIVGLCLLITFLTWSWSVVAFEKTAWIEDNEEVSAAIESAMEPATEPEITEELAESHPFKRPGAKTDPFQPLIKKPERLPPKIVISEKGGTKDKMAPPPKPLAIRICGIVGKKDDRLALITFDNKVYIIRVGTEVDDKFKVVAIEEHSITVYANAEKIRKTFNM